MATKKVKHRTDVPPDLNGPTVDRNGQVVRETNVPKDSHKTKLLGAHSDQNTCTNMKEIFELQNGDVATEDKNDFDKVLMGGPWVIFGHYLTVRLWSSDFSTANVISPVVKIDAHTNAVARGRFARMAVCMDLNKPLVSKHGSNFCLRRQVAGAKKGKWRSFSGVKIDGGVNCVGGSRFSMLKTDNIQTGSIRHTRIEEKSDEIVNWDRISA
ncbi:hypothetical protein GOBAR_DD26595 [Gossypium barbadense]|nr:hypothetical protein GOBAR_DD26595 [Gossypium barbadense]